MPIRCERTALAIAALLSILGGCTGEPSDREARNARAFETLLAAASLRDPRALEDASATIETRHQAGDLSDARHKELAPIVAQAKAGDWAGALDLAYAFRARFGDRGAYFR